MFSDNALFISVFLIIIDGEHCFGCSMHMGDAYDSAKFFRSFRGGFSYEYSRWETIKTNDGKYYSWIMSHSLKSDASSTVYSLHETPHFDFVFHKFHDTYETYKLFLASVKFDFHTLDSIYIHQPFQVTEKDFGKISLYFPDSSGTLVAGKQSRVEIHTELNDSLIPLLRKNQVQVYFENNFYESRMLVQQEGNKWVLLITPGDYAYKISIAMSRSIGYNRRPDLLRADIPVKRGP